MKNTLQKEILTPAQWLSFGGILLYSRSYRKILFFFGGGGIFLIAPGKKVISHQQKAIEQGYIFRMCSSHQDRYVHQFSDDYVDARYRLYRSGEKL